jgi:hypothetical protein
MLTLGFVSPRPGTDFSEMPALLASRAICVWNRNIFQLEWLPQGLRKMRGIDASSLGERRVPYGRDHERHFPGRGRVFHFDWNVLKGTRHPGQRAPNARSRIPQT